MHHEPAPGLYRHYKGGEYRVVGSARRSETDELLVVCRCFYDNDSLGERVPDLAPLLYDTMWHRRCCGDTFPSGGSL